VPGDLGQYVGDYYSDELDVTYRLHVDRDTLVLRIGYREPASVGFLGAGAARARVGLLVFQRDADGTTTGFRLNAGRVQGVEFVRR